MSRGAWIAIAAACVLAAAPPARAEDPKPAAKAPSPKPDPPPPDDPPLDAAARKRFDELVRENLEYLRKEKNRESVRLRIESMGKSGLREDRDALIEFSKGNPNQAYVDAAFAALSHYKTKPVYDFLLGKDGLSGTEYMLQIAAADALRLMGHVYAVPQLVAVLDRPGTKIEVQGACLLAVAKCGGKDARAQEAVLRYAAHKHDTVRANAIEALGWIKVDAAYDRLIDRLENEKNTRCRGAAATGLGEFGRKQAAPALRRALGDDAMTVRALAEKALAKLGEKP